MTRTILIFCVLTLSGCDIINERMGGPNPAKEAREVAEAEALGAGCRHSGRGIEACYDANTSKSKAAIYKGWTSMHEYMVEKQMTAQLPVPEVPASPTAAPVTKADSKLPSVAPNKEAH